MLRARQIILGSLAVVPVLGAQTPVSLHLGTPTAAPSEEFTKVISAHEIAPGRLLVADERDRRLVLIDFGASNSRQVGRTGAGPGEFRSLGTVLPRHGGGAFLVDFVQRRLLPVLPDGSTGDVVPFPSASVQLATGDSSGRLYGSSMIFRNRELSDSMHILRWSPGARVVDTLLTFDAGRSGMIIHAGEKRRVWYPTTSWAPLADGSIALVDAATYRMRRWAAGSVREVAALPFEAKPVTAQDREAFLDAEKNVKPMMMGQSGAAPAAAPPRPESTFPATYPAFGPDTPLQLAPDGSLWISRLVSPRDSVPVTDILSPSGRLLARLRLPPRSRVLAFGSGSLYLLERDADDVERVRRYAYPAVPRP